MKHLFFRLFTMMVMVAALVSCSCMKGSGKYDTHTAACDSLYQHGWDSVSIGIFRKFCVKRISRLDPVAEIDSNATVIAGFKVMDKSRKLSKDHQAVLKFLLRNPDSYAKNKNRIKTIFAPYLVLELSDNKYLLIGFNSDEWAVASKDSVISVREYTCKRQLLRLGMEIYPDDKYLKAISETVK